MKYWLEAVSCALDEVGLKATKEQIEIIAGSIEVSHENYGMAHGYDCIPNPLKQELKKYKNLYIKERNKKTCPECLGKRYVTIGDGDYGTGRYCTSLCLKCNGEGKI